MLSNKTIKICTIVVLSIILIGIIAWFATGSLRHRASDSYYKSAQDLIEKNKPDEAVSNLEKAIFLYPSNHEALYLEGKIHYQNLSFARALSCFKRAYFKKPDNNLYLLAFADSALKLNKESYLLNILDNRPADDLVNSIFFLTHLQTLKDDPLMSSNSQVELSAGEKDASSDLKKIKDQELKNYLSLILDLLKDPDAKIEGLSVFKKFAIPEFVSWHLNLSTDDLNRISQFEEERGKTEIDKSKKLMALNLFCDLGFGGLVIPRTEILTKDYPEYRDTWLVLGRAQFIEMNYESAKDSFNQAQKLDPNYLPTLEMLAKTYYVLDLADEEMDIRAKIEKLNH